MPLKRKYRLFKGMRGRVEFPISIQRDNRASQTKPGCEESGPKRADISSIQLHNRVRVDAFVSKQVGKRAATLPFLGYSLPLATFSIPNIRAVVSPLVGKP